MRFWRVLRRLAVAVPVCWLGGCVVSFLSGFLLTVLPIPWNLPLPWSDFNDFVETPDGRVFVSVRFYNRALCYDRSGRFLAAYRFPRGAKDTRMAVGTDGLVYVRAKNTVYTYTSDWDLLSVAQGDVPGERVWELDKDTGRPAHAPHRLGEAPPDRPHGPGELLFSRTAGREAFHCSDGSTLRRAGNGLERVSPEGEVVAAYGTPWPLRPFVFPFPACVPWVGILLFGLWRGFRARRAAGQGGGSSA